jgi:fatty-acyl-CoA synthase
MVVALKPDYKGKVTAGELQQFMKAFADQGRLPKFAVPERFEFVDAIPKTSVGKLNKRVIRQQHN